MKKPAAVVAVSLFLIAHAALAATPAEKCAAAKNKAALKQAGAKAKCYQRAFAKSLSVDANCLLAADQALVDAIDKIDTKGGCVNTGDSSAIQGAVDNCVDSIVALTPSEAASCSLTATCTAGHDCVSLVDNSAVPIFGLRMSQLDLSGPSALAGGVVGPLLHSDIVINGESACNMNGTGSFSWLLKFDRTGFLTIGGAKPVANTAAGFSLVDEFVSAVHLAPLTLNLNIAGDNTFSTTTTGNLNLPVYLDSGATNSILLPLHSVSVTGALSSNQSCIGSYNAAGLQATNMCLPDGINESFIDGGTVHAFINLEDADSVVVAPLSQSLCVLLSGNAVLYGNGANPAHCKRTASVIDFQGDWCATTNSVAFPGCTDSVEFSGNFAASSVKINN